MDSFRSSSSDIFSYNSDTDSIRFSTKDDQQYDILSRVIRGRSVQIPLDQASTYQETSGVLMSSAEIKAIPGARMLYRRYTRQRRNILLVSHCWGYAIEIVMFIMGTVFAQDAPDKHDKTPFTMNSIMVLVFWCYLLAHRAAFIPQLFSQTLTSIDLIQWQLGLLYIPTYAWIGFFFLVRNLLNALWIAILIVVALSIQVLIQYRLYHKIKYQDDGRFFMTRNEFFSIHVHMSLYVSWVLVNLIHYIFVCLSFMPSYLGHDFLGWENYKWSLLSVCVVFVLGVISLATYKDVFFAFSTAYSMVAIYIEQTFGYAWNHAYSNNCSSEVGVLAISFCSVQIFMVLITMWKHWDKIFYNKRRTTNN